MIRKIKTIVCNFCMEIEPYLAVDIVAGILASLLIVYMMLVALVSLS
jgi:hypothetical protein